MFLIQQRRDCSRDSSAIVTVAFPDSLSICRENHYSGRATSALAHVLHSARFPDFVTACNLLALEHKDGRSYYYRSVRQGELVRKKYVGAGLSAAQAAQTDRRARARCEAQALKENQERERIEW